MSKLIRLYLIVTNYLNVRILCVDLKFIVYLVSPQLLMIEEKAEYKLTWLALHLKAGSGIDSGVSRISFRGGVQIFSGKVGVFAWREARGVRGHAPPRNFLKMVQFGAF